jgi:hypothetical protein
MCSRLLIAFGVALMVSHCGYGNFQTAKTVPKGSYRITSAQQFQGNEDLDERGVAATNFPPELMVRVGVTDRLDLGASVLMMGGLLIDAKVNVFPRMDRFALAFGGGIGAALDWGSLDVDEMSAVLNLPLKAIVSYRIGAGFSPYFCLGYSFFWIFGRDASDIPPPEDPNTTYVDRQGYGDGLLRFTVGYEYKFTVRFGLLMEYSFWLPVVDDPGDFYTFIPNHMGGFGFVF